MVGCTNRGWIPDPPRVLRLVVPAAESAVDYAGGVPSLLRKAPSIAVRHALAAGKELIWLAAHVALYPAGVLAEQHEMHDPRHRIDTLSPLTRGLILEDIAAAGTPIVLVHGIVDNRSAFAVLRRTLRRRGYGRITTVNYSPTTSDIRKAARYLAKHVERVCAQSGYEQVYIVGHSLGGIIARYYVQCMGGDERVNTLITLGSPHAGTHAARLLPLKVTRQLRPGSDLMRELAAPARCRARFVAIYSDRDEVVLPQRSARLDHPDLSVTPIKIHGVGHLALLVDREAVHTVADALTARIAAGVAEELGAERIRAESTGYVTELPSREKLGYGSATPPR
jgi:pimeloyl-ACP methyl ester carboxylesterase